MRAPAAHASPALSREAYFATLAKRHGVENQQKLARARVGIAGLGGLGSAAACHLARLGVGTLVLVDFDVVDVSNLHRQQYTCAQVGMKKTEALAETLRAI
ncbi:MAG: ThiF family adenylyltransferase, partial [Eggerthellaceae bacterium]